MNLLWFLMGVGIGVAAYHHTVPYIVAKTGKSREVLQAVTRGLNHDAFANLKFAVEEEAKRRGLDSEEN